MYKSSSDAGTKNDELYSPRVRVCLDPHPYSLDIAFNYSCTRRRSSVYGVFLRFPSLCRPFSEDELRNNAPQVVTCNDYQREVAISQTIAGKQIDRIFTFDKVALSISVLFT